MERDRRPSRCNRPTFPVAACRAGNGFSLAIGSDSKLYAWGTNGAAQLGDGTTSIQDSPEAITLASGVTPTAISAGSYHCLAIGSDGKLYAWGGSNYGELGDGKAFNVVDIPEAITLASGVKPTTISAGNYDNLAIGSDGKLYAWGYNAHGELGDGTTNNQSIPEAITLAVGVTPTAIAANGWEHTLAIGSSSPPPVTTPETSIVIALPVVTAAALFSGVWLTARRRRVRTS